MSQRRCPTAGNGRLEATPFFPLRAPKDGTSSNKNIATPLFLKTFYNLHTIFTKIFSKFFIFYSKSKFRPLQLHWHHFQRIGSCSVNFCRISKIHASFWWELSHESKSDYCSENGNDFSGLYHVYKMTFQWVGMVVLQWPSTDGPRSDLT
jgi:hypothetical protein